MKMVTKGWKKVKDDAYNKLYEKKFDDALVKVWAYVDPDAGPGVWMPEYHWTIEYDGNNDFVISSRGTYESAEEAAQFAEDTLKRQEVSTGQWTKELPTKPGRYWFYGWPYQGAHKVELSHVLLIENIIGIVFIRDGRKWLCPEKAVGLFCEAILPELPDVGGLTIEDNKGEK